MMALEAIRKHVHPRLHDPSSSIGNRLLFIDYLLQLSPIAQYSSLRIKFKSTFNSM
jgi:hypothetical protein